MSTTKTEKQSKVGLSDEAKAAAAAKTSTPANRPSGPVAATMVSAGSLPKGMTSDQLDKKAVDAKEHRATTSAPKRTRATGKKATTAKTPAPRKAAGAVKSAPAGTNPVSGTARLASGGLGQLVEKHMKAHPGEALTPTEVAKALGRSSGAVGNALERLVTAGTVKRTSAKPRRYAAPKAAQGSKAA